MRILFRILAGLGIVVLVFTMPWWLSCIVICAGIFWFGYYYESIFFALLLDGFHGTPGVFVFGSNSFFVVITGFILIVSLLLRTRLTFY